jgi:hypothetical protein
LPNGWRVAAGLRAAEHTPSRAYRVGRIEFITEEFTTMGLSAEVCESFVTDCINVKALQRLAAAIDARLAALDAKVKAKSSLGQ